MLEDPCCCSSTVRSDTCKLLGSTTQTAGWLSSMVSAVAGSSMPLLPSMRACPNTVAPSCMASGHSSSPTFTRKGWVVRRCGLPHAAGGTDARIVGQRDGDHDVRGGLAHEGCGHVKHRVHPALLRDRDDRLAGLYHLAGLRAPGDHDARRVSPKLAVAEMVLGLM